MLSDTPDQTLLRISTGKQREEWVLLNTGGNAVKVEKLDTDACEVYLDVQEGRVVHALAISGTYLAFDGKEVFRQAQRGDWEKA